MNKTPMHDGKPSSDSGQTWNTQLQSSLVASGRSSKAAPAPAHKEAPPAIAISEEAIARRAYAKFQARGEAPGMDREDWAEAERELSEEAAARAT